MQYNINHHTRYVYSTPVSRSHHLLHLSPRAVPGQSVQRHSFLIDPAPGERIDRVDEFGNPVTLITFESDHTELNVHSRAQIEVTPPSRTNPLLATERVDDLPRTLKGSNGNIDLDVIRFRVGSPQTRPTPAIMQFAAKSFPPDRPVMAGAWDLTQRIFNEFEFDPAATDISTPVSEVLAARRGVCQDFTHLMLTCLRATGIPARYVSGYLLTHPPAGQPRLQGADASHAWVSVWTSETGWVDMDPTNGLLPGDEHITIAYGREFDDVSPISGVLLGGHDHSVEVSVDVEPI